MRAQPERKYYAVDGSDGPVLMHSKMPPADGVELSLEEAGLLAARIEERTQPVDRRTEGQGTVHDGAGVEALLERIRAIEETQAVHTQNFIAIKGG